MTMRFIQIPVYWNSEEAQTVIAFLDQIKEVICDNYAHHIQQDMANYRDCREHQIDLFENSEQEVEF